MSTIDYSSLGFKYYPTDYYYIGTFKDCQWGEGKLTQDLLLALVCFPKSFIMVKKRSKV